MANLYDKHHQSMTWNRILEVQLAGNWITTWSHYKVNAAFSFHIGQCFHIHIFKACFYYISRNNQLSIRCSFSICSRHQLECISTIALQHVSKFGLFSHTFLQLHDGFLSTSRKTTVIQLFVWMWNKLALTMLFSSPFSCESVSWPSPARLPTPNLPPTPACHGF